jgi:hypothetical protein
MERVCMYKSNRLVCMSLERTFGTTLSSVIMVNN